MDYEKKYKEALERARLSRLQLLDIGEEATEIEYIFPELAESEDEKIGKELIKLMRQMSDTIVENYTPVPISDFVAWLERQVEQKPQRMISAEAKEAMYDKPAWSEEDQNALEDVREAVVNYWGGDSQDILLYWLKSIKQKIKGE